MGLAILLFKKTSVGAATVLRRIAFATTIVIIPNTVATLKPDEPF